jgi:toxin secretion/phage lysis holin
MLAHSDNVAPRAGKWTVAIVAAFWLKIPYMVKLLLGMMALDMVTGLLASFIRKETSSESGARGLAKKALVLILVGVSHIVSDPLHLGVDLGSAVALAYMFNELISIIENAARAGVPIPGPLIDVLRKFKGIPKISSTATGSFKALHLPAPEKKTDK